MELRHLRYFIAVAEELSFRRGAERLNVSHSPLNRQINDLEIELGTRLLLRTHHGVRLTPAGQLYLDEARAIVARTAHAATLAKKAEHGHAGKLRIGHSYGYVDESLPAVIATLRDRYPDIEIELVQAHARHQFEALVSHELDIGYCAVRPPGIDPRLELECVRRSEQGVVLSPRHPLATAPHIALADLAKEPFFCLRRSEVPQFHAALSSACTAAGFEPIIAREVDSITTILGLVAAGIGVAILPAISLTPNLDVRFRALEPALPPLGYHVAWLHDDTNPLVMRFLEALREHLAHVAGDPFGQRCLTGATPGPK